jgi:hypothetical protein
MKLTVTNVVLTDGLIKHGQQLSGQATFSDGKHYDFIIGPRNIYIRFVVFTHKNGEWHSKGFHSSKREYPLLEWLKCNEEIDTRMRA